MPDPRPLSSLRLGAYDDPPATTSEPSTSTPQTRRSRLRRAIDETRDLARRPPSPRITLPMPTSGARRSIYVAPSTHHLRRRQRSPSSGREDENTRGELEEGSGGDVDENSSASGRRQRRPPKRPRLDPSSLSARHHPNSKAIKYGYYGQVEPGRLKLDLISCDGGEHRDPRHPGTSLGPENVLRHDKSVYCSERPYSNLVMRHSDGTAFCLEKLFVVGPDVGFTAPVREGLVYIAMTLKDLQKYIDPPPHARRSRFPSPPPPPPPNHSHHHHRGGFTDRSLRSSPERLTLSDALRDSELNAAFDERAREGERDVEHVPDFAASSNSNDNNYTQAFDFASTRADAEVEAHCELPPSPLDPNEDFPGSFSSYAYHPSYSSGGGSEAESARLPRPHHRAITLLSDEEPGPEDDSSQDVLDYRQRRLRLARRRVEADRWEGEGRWAGLSRLPGERERERERGGEGERGVDAGSGSASANGGVWGLNRLDALMARSRVHDSASASPERAIAPALPPPLPRARSPLGRAHAAATTPVAPSEPSAHYTATALDAPPTMAEKPPHPDESGFNLNPNASSNVNGNGSGNSNVTLASFHIRRNRHQVALRFDPPVSGRFLLLKVWAERGRGDANVDLQSVVAVGFGGGRFFPSWGFR